MKRIIVLLSTKFNLNYSEEAEHFELEKPDFPIIEQVRADLEEYEANWLLYEEFNTGLHDLAKQDWIAFRSGCLNH